MYSEIDTNAEFGEEILNAFVANGNQVTSNSMIYQNAAFAEEHKRRGRGEEGVKMQQRKSASSFGRPSGTDGSDFSYRMVVDSRYTKVAKGKSRLHVLIIAQAIIHLIGGLSRFLLSTSKEGPDKLAIATVALGFISLVIGELGQRRSRENFLRLYMITSSIAFLLSTAFVVQKNSLIEVLQDMSGGEMKLFELLEIGYVVLGFLLQISTISTIITLIWNMSPPKKAS